MKEMGIVDEGLALQALQIMGGDLQVRILKVNLSRQPKNIAGCCRSHFLWLGRRR